MTAVSDTTRPLGKKRGRRAGHATLRRRVAGLLVAIGPATVRGRLMGLLLCAAVPVLTMAAFVAWQNYLTLAGQADTRVLMAREAAVARHYGAVDGIERLLNGVAAVLPDDMDADTCDARLRAALKLQGDRLVNLSLLDADGHLLCSALPLDGSAVPRGTSFAATSWFARLRAGGAPAGSVVWGAISRRHIVLLPVEVPAPTFGVLVAAVRLDWLATAAPGAAAAHTLIWIVDAAGRPVEDEPADFPPALDLPKPSAVAAIFASSGAVRTRSRSGAPYAYAAAPLDGGLRLLVAEPAAADLHRARSALKWRLAELCGLLAAGVAAVAIGANRTVVSPLRRLARSVARWRDGEEPDLVPGLGAPQEVRDLSRSFAQAVGELAQREAQLRGAMEQQELLMQEIHHRVKNNLQIIASLLNLQSSRIRSPAARAEFQAARDRVQALATLHRHLYTHGNFQSLNMRSFLAELCGQLLEAMGEPMDDPSSRIRVEIDAPELRINSDQAVPIALIVTEAVGNAAKYAFPGGRAGHIRIGLAVSPGAVHLEIADDGVGFPRPNAASGVGDGIGIGIGLRLIRGFSRQLGATLALETEHGTRYALTIPMPLRPDRAATADAMPG